MAKWFDWVLGAVFVVGAVLKATDMDAFMVQVRAYQVITDLELIRGVAWVTLLLETALGIGLLLNRRMAGATYAVTMGILVGFTGLMIYAWQVHGLEDCGCFGAAITMPIWASILKNLVMIGMAGAAWAATRGKSPETVSQPRRIILGGGSLMAVIIAGTSGNAAQPAQAPPMTPVQQSEAAPSPQSSTPQPAGPFAQFSIEHEGQQFKLAEGTFFVPVLSATCDHCMSTVPDLNTLSLMPEAPPLVALVAGKPDQLAEFRAFTSPEFAIIPIEMITMFEFLPEGVSAPPVFYLTQDGTPIQHWAEHPPDINQLLNPNE